MLNNFSFVQISISREELVGSWRKSSPQVRQIPVGGRQIQIDEWGRISGSLRVTIVNGSKRKTIIVQGDYYSTSDEDLMSQCIINLDPLMKKWIHGVGTTGIALSTKVSGTD